MKIVTYRTIFNPDSTGGRTYIDGEFFCHTQEDAVRGYGIKIDGETAVGAGLYKVDIRYSPSFDRYMAILYNHGMLCVANGISFSYIYSHGGNTAGDSKGCLLNAKYRKDNETIYSTMEGGIYTLVKEAIDRNEKVTWMIVNDPDKQLEPNQ